MHLVTVESLYTSKCNVCYNRDFFEVLSLDQGMKLKPGQCDT